MRDEKPAQDEEEPDAVLSERMTDEATEAVTDQNQQDRNPADTVERRNPHHARSHLIGQWASPLMLESPAAQGFGWFVARPGRFERPAPALGGRCSIHLSYGRGKENF